MNAYKLIRPLLFSLPAECAHNLSLNALKIGANLGLTKCIAHPNVNPVEVMGLKFANRVGLAAGLDKDGIAIDGLADLGFGFIEVGTVTPRAQAGNAKPRLFRLKQQQAIINRMGFNNLGAQNLVNNVNKAKFNGVLGVNIGKNLTTSIEDAHQDYVSCLQTVYQVADYVAVNLSSPNTPNLRNLQYGDALKKLLEVLLNEREVLAQKYNKKVPLVLKIAPDLTADELINIADILLEFKIDAVIATNTTLDRQQVSASKYAHESGGLSGVPLFEANNKIIQILHNHCANKLAIIACGGINSADDALHKIKLGAQLVQIYTGFIYQGPRLIADCVKQLSATSL